MKHEKQRIAIAKLCGWEESQMSKRCCFDPRGFSTYWDNAPDYLHDLNACHAFEEQLTWSHEDGRGTCSVYREHLERIVHEKWKSRDTECAAECHEWHATAAQRCEAFLRTMGKWEDEK